MKVTYLDQIKYKKSTWSGGETKEIYLSPIQGIYEVEKFNFRLSTATVELSETTFTSLKGYKRLILSLDRPLKLVHQRNKKNVEVLLAPFEIHYFLGEEQTKSFGKCTDFNLIFKEQLTGAMDTYLNRATFTFFPEQTYIVYGLEEAVLRFSKNNEIVKSIHLHKGDSLIFEELTEGYQVELVGKRNTEAEIAVVASIVEC